MHSTTFEDLKNDRRLKTVSFTLPVLIGVCEDVFYCIQPTESRKYPEDCIQIHIR